jgi:predicted ABC-type ATPase
MNYRVHYGGHRVPENTAPRTYTSQRAAIRAARELAQSYGDTIDTITVTTGEYELQREVYRLHRDIDGWHAVA